MSYGDYYNPTNKSVSDGAIVYAEDVNKINTAVDSGFEQVASDLDELATSIGDGGIASKDWATEDAGTRPDPILDLYSSRAYAAEAKGWASASGTITEASTGLPLAGSSSAKTQATAAAASASTASGHATTASNAAIAAAASASSASGFATTASGHATSASGSAVAASDSADDASSYASTANGYVSDASGYATQASGFADDASGFASAASGFADDASDFADDAAASAIDAANASSKKSAVINGNFDIWQRGTSQTSSGYGSDDRWYNGHTGSTKTHSRKPFTPGLSGVPNSPKYYSSTVVSTVAGAGNNVTKQQRIESVYTFAGETVLLSFYAKADASRSMAANLTQFFGTGGSPSATFHTDGQKINLTTDWQRFTLTFILPTLLGKTVGTDNNDWLGIYFWFDAGSNYDARTGTLGQQSGTFDIAQVQLKVGSVATDFENKSIGEELQLCYRYTELLRGTAIAGESYRHQRYTVTKRATPSVNIVYGGYGGANIDISEYSFRVGSTVASSSSQDFVVLVEAEL